MLAAIAAVLPILDKLIPDPQAAAAAKLEAMRLVQAGEFKELETAVAIGQQQASVNAVEAQQGAFRGGWRPFVGWVCGAGLAYQYLARPLLPWAFAVGGVDVPTLPALDVAELVGLLAGMLGLSGLRTLERKAGRA